MTKKTQLAIGAVVVAGVALGAFMYISRPLAAPTTVNAPTAPVTTQAGEQVFVIDSTKSTATYEIDETLSGTDVHVVGVSPDVRGQIVLNAVNPAASQVGPITINARTFKTDSDRRDNTVGRAILKSEDPANELITFTVAKWFEVPEKIVDGQEFAFSVIGNVTIAGKTQEVAFNGRATKTGATLAGSAESVINYADFGLTIPKLPFLAWVDDKVAISLNFVANAQ